MHECQNQVTTWYKNKQKEKKIKQPKTTQND